MPKILIVSDSHGLTDEIKQIKEQHQTEYAIHCGDSELDLDAPELEGFVKVAGNCDVDTRFPDEQLTEIAGVKIFVAHGHLYQVKSDLMPLSYRAQEEGASVVCFGHTHIAGAEKVAGQLFINPGSIRLPKNRREKTYAIMEWTTEDDVAVSFYTTDGKLVHELTYHTSL